MRSDSFPSLFLAAILGASSLPSSAQIGVANSDFLRSTTTATSYTKSFDAGATADKLIVSAAYEGGPDNSALTITYHGVALTMVPGTSGNRNEGIWYLDNPHTGGAADIVISGGGTNFGAMGMGIVSIAGSAGGSAVAGKSTSSVTLDVPVADCFVFAHCAANDGAIPTPAAPLAELYRGALNSSEGAAGYANGVAGGSQSFSFSGSLNSPETSAAVFVPASAAPVIVGTSPADDEVNVLPDVNLTVTFSEPVVAGTGAIVLKNADDSTVESFDVATSPRLTLNGSQITIDPTNDLDPAGGYYVLMDAGVVVDTSGGEAFAGIADPTVWNFGEVPPSLVAVSPADDELNVLVGANLVATFDEPVAAGTGTITLRKSSDNSTVESFDVATSPRLSISGAELTIDPTGDLEIGVEHHVLIDPTAIEDLASNPFNGISDPATWSFTTRPGLDTVEGRMVAMLQENIDNPWPGITDPNNSAGVFSYVLACLHLNQNVSQANQLIVDYYTNNPIPANTSTSYGGYFWQHIMWRTYHDPTAGSRMTSAARDLLEDNMWNWVLNRSTLAEAQQNVWKIHDSENHDAMQKGSHLMCLLALKSSTRYGPDRVLSDGGTVADHLAAWTGFYLRYFKSRAMEGINVEIACQQYAKYTVGAYYNIMDFSDSPELRTLAETFMDLYWADTASDWVSSGVRGGGQTRCYREGNYLKTGTSYSFYGLLYGYGWHDGSSSVRTYPMIPATSPYRVPDIITAIATDPARPNFLYSSRRFGRGGGWDGNKDYSVVFDNGDSNLRRDTWVTPDYSMGTLTVDMNRDYIALIDQNRVMGIMFASGPNDRIMVFGQGGSDPTKSFADTTGVTREDCMIVQRDKNAYQTGTATQIFIAQAAWDNRVETGDWFFTQLGNAYCALRPAGGGYTATSTSRGYYLELGDLWAPVIIQTGQAHNYTDFTDFQNSVIANSLTYVSGTMNYTSEAGDTFTFHANSKTTPKVNGTTVNLNPTKTYDSPYLSMVHGEEVATVSHTGFADLVLDFGGPPTLLATDPADDATGVSIASDLAASFNKPVVAGSGSIVLRRSERRQRGRDIRCVEFSPADL
jgi:methionine-rich copper-binding protein CopC